MSSLAIRVEKLGKRYRIGRHEPYRTLRDTVATILTAPFVRPKSRPLSARSRSDSDFIWALRNVSFEVKHGEAVGIIGRNGAGKSTLLKILSKITEPTEGAATICGRVGSLLEVGTGFHPELTGRENIYLNGAILGMARSEIQKRFDEIVSFAELEKFIDTPAKHYSSGMYMRLAFAVAAHLNPEILLVDEVLAVGDVRFQNKCLGKMTDVARSGRTILFVSHNLGAIRQLCQRAIWIDQGNLAEDGHAPEVVTRYLEVSGEGVGLDHLESDYLGIDKVLLTDRMGRKKSSFFPGEDLVIEIHYRAKKVIPKPFFWVNVIGQYGPLFGANMLFDGHSPKFIEGQGTLTCTLKKIPLLPQTYSVRLGVRGENGVTFLIKTSEVAYFSVDGGVEDIGWREERAGSLMNNAAPIFIPYEWKLPDGGVVSVQPTWTMKHGKMPDHPED